ncbi:MAG: hypothetical protein ACRDZY_17685 [Acidimicrobiales bacterium]
MPKIPPQQDPRDGDPEDEHQIPMFENLDLSEIEDGDDEIEAEDDEDDDSLDEIDEVEDDDPADA